MNYPKKAPEGKGQDSILIFEDSKGTGHFDKRTVFMEGLNLVSGIEVGFGGVWVGQAPQLLFIPILEGDKPGKPRSAARRLRLQRHARNAQQLQLGPRRLALRLPRRLQPAAKSASPARRTRSASPMNAAVWRFHPTRKTFEIFAEGGSNQWGIDWDEHGQTVHDLLRDPAPVPRHPGRPLRAAGRPAHRPVYLRRHQDHRRPPALGTGAANQWAANNKSDATGGGHAHAGAMIYLGDNLPAEYRNKIFMGNIHGNRINNDILEPQGSGYVGHHGKDFLLMNDKWSRLISMKYGPDGGVYVIDWYDKQACHLPKPEVWDRSNGRIYKITYGDPKPVKVDLAKLPRRRSDRGHAGRQRMAAAARAAGPARAGCRRPRERASEFCTVADQVVPKGDVNPLWIAWTMAAIKPFDSENGDRLHRSGDRD